MPRAKKTKDEELEDLVDDLDDLDEDEDEDVDVEDEDVEEDEDEDDEDPDEAPKAKKGRKSSSKKAAAKKVRTGIGTKEVAEAADVESRVLRNYLRSAEIQPRSDREGRYEWNSLNDPEVKRIIKAIQQGKAKQAAKKETEEVKGKKVASKKKATAKSKG